MGENRASIQDRDEYETGMDFLCSSSVNGGPSGYLVEVCASLDFGKTSQHVNCIFLGA